MVDLERLIGTGQSGLVLSIEPVRGRLGLVRAQVRRYLHQHGVHDDDWPLIANELVANAIDAMAGRGTRAGTGGPAIRLSLEADPSRVQLMVANVGPAYELREPGSGAPAPARRGRGLHLVRALVDGLDVRHVEGVTITTCWRACRAEPDR